MINAVCVTCDSSKLFIVLRNLAHCFRVCCDRCSVNMSNKLWCAEDFKMRKTTEVWSSLGQQGGRIRSRQEKRREKGRGNRKEGSKAHSKGSEITSDDRLRLRICARFPITPYSFKNGLSLCYWSTAAAQSLHSCPTLCDSSDGSPLGSPIPGILQARTLEWVAISFSGLLMSLK